MEWLHFPGRGALGRPILAGACVVLALFVAGGGIASTEPEPASSPAAAPNRLPSGSPAAVQPTPLAVATLSPADVERLEALGYLDTVPGPADPGPSGVIRRDASRSWPGFDLFTNAHACSADLLDGGGRRVHSWSSSPCFRWGNSVLLPDGDLLVVEQGRSPGSRRPAGRGGRRAARERSPDPTLREGGEWESYVARLSWDGTVRWRKPLRAHHDAQPAPRGGVVTLTARLRDLPEIDAARPVRDDVVTLLSSAGEVQGELSLYDVLRRAPSPFRLLPGRRKRQVRDLIHANSVAWMPPDLAGRAPLYAASNLLVCLRHQNAIAVLDWEGKRVVWTWGQDQLSGPHDATVLPSGNFLVFDNGLERSWSRVIELDPLSGEIVWEYRATPPESFKTQTRGSSQRLPNGNTLIAESDRGRAFEVTAGGELVWELLNPNLVDGRRSAIVRIRRLAPSWVEPLLAAKGVAPDASPQPPLGRAEPAGRVVVERQR